MRQVFPRGGAVRPPRAAIGACVWLGLSAAVPGCVYIGPDELVEATGCLDEDRDGARPRPTGECAGDPIDCDDDDAERSPEFDEAPYDRIDNDCDGFNLDLVDVDGDGFPGISFEQWSLITRVQGDLAQWPPGMDERADCDDGNADVNPGKTDAPYDGVDQDCSTGGVVGDEEYDADGDGFGSDEYGGDDCDDADDTTYPGAPDKFYDDLDSDCLGNDDLDADADGYSSAAHGGDDCLDDPALAPSGLLAFDVHPDAIDDFYDGVDMDCAGNDDFDADGDLYHDPQYDAAFATYAADWGIPVVSCHIASSVGGIGVCGGLDCDDDDPAVHPWDADDDRPAASEALGDTVDQDCDGHVDSATFVTGGYQWTAPRSPVVVNNGRHWLIGLGESATSGVTAREGGVIVWFEPGTPPSDPVEMSTWFSLSVPPTLGDAIDLVPTADGFEGVVGYRTTTSSVVMLKHGVWNATNEDYSASRTQYVQLNGVQDTFHAVGVTTDAIGRVWGYGVGDTVSAFVVADGTATTFPKVSGGSQVAAVPHDGVIFDVGGGSSGLVTSCGDGACFTSTVDVSATIGSIAPATTQPYLAQAPARATQTSRARVFVPAAGTGATWLDAASAPHAVFSGLTVRKAGVDTDGTRVYAAALVADVTSDGVDDLVVEYGPIAGPLTRVARAITVHGAPIAPTGVDLAVSNGEIVLAVTGTPADGSCADPGGVLCDVTAWQKLGSGPNP